MENAKYLYLRSYENLSAEKYQSLVMGAMHSRALSARDRIILNTRMLKILDFMKAIDPDVFKRQLVELLRELDFDVHSYVFEPYLNLKKEDAFQT